MTAARIAGSRLTRALFGVSDFAASLVLVFAVLGLLLAPFVLTQPRVNGTVPLTHLEAVLMAADCALLALGAWLAGRRRVIALVLLAASAVLALFLPAAAILVLALALMVLFALPLLCAWRELRTPPDITPEERSRTPD